MLLYADKEDQTALQLTAVDRPQVTIQASVLLYATHNEENNTSVYHITLFKDVSLSKMHSYRRSGGSGEIVESSQLSKQPSLN